MKTFLKEYGFVVAGAILMMVIIVAMGSPFEISIWQLIKGLFLLALVGINFVGIGAAFVYFFQGRNDEESYGKLIIILTAVIIMLLITAFFLMMAGKLTTISLIYGAFAAALWMMRRKITKKVKACQV